MRFYGVFNFALRHFRSTAISLERINVVMRGTTVFEKNLLPSFDFPLHTCVILFVLTSFHIAQSCTHVSPPCPSHFLFSQKFCGVRISWKLVAGPRYPSRNLNLGLPSLSTALLTTIINWPFCVHWLRMPLLVYYKGCLKLLNIIIRNIRKNRTLFKWSDQVVFQECVESVCCNGTPQQWLEQAMHKADLPLSCSLC